MSAEPLEGLLQNLNLGDVGSAERIFFAYEPMLRKVVRRMLPTPMQAKFDSIDVVQSVWADLLDQFREAGDRFTGPEHLRAFLVKATRNRFIDRYRQHRKAVAFERPMLGEAQDAPPSAEPRPSEVVQAEELWDKLLALCPPEHHRLLDLKRQGLSLAEIADRTGMHVDSVRRIVRQLARRLALHA